jgi:hypothetical protein
VQLPYPGAAGAPPDIETPPPGHIVVTPDDIWVVVGLDDHLARVDLATNEVTDLITLGIPVVPMAGGAGLWLFGPVGVAPSPPSSTLFRVDAGSLELSRFEFDHPINRMVVGDDAVWVLDGRRLIKVDPLTGDIAASRRVVAWDLEAACGGIWVDVSETANWDVGTRLLARVDQASATILDPIEVPTGELLTAAGRCWIQAGIQLYELTGTEVQQIRIGNTFIAGDSFWKMIVPGLIQRIDPATLAAIGPRWRLDPDAFRPDFKGATDWHLFSADGSLWLANGYELVRYDISTGGLD